MRSDPLRLLDNVIWNALSGTQARFAAGEGGARRYARGFSPIVAFRDPQSPDFESLTRVCDRGEHFYCDLWSGAAPPGWQVDQESRMLKMVWDSGRAAEAGDPAPAAVPLTAAHAPQAVALATLTNPGPFGLRTLELGDYFGYFEGGQLIAMAGERMAAGALREISGVCTHPDHQGRGLARRLTEKILRRQLARGEIPFLHVMSVNETARRLYEKMGFRSYLETTVRIISRT